VFLLYAIKQEGTSPSVAELCQHKVL
jgi:hypothetical protein